MASTRENKTISQFKSQLIGGGARPNLFEVELTTLPAGIAWPADNFRYMCKAAQLPASVIANVDIPFRGRIFKVAGDRTIEPWSITIINDEDFRIRKAMEEWVDLIAKLENIVLELEEIIVKGSNILVGWMVVVAVCEVCRKVRQEVRLEVRLEPHLNSVTLNNVIC